MLKAQCRLQHWHLNFSRDAFLNLPPSEQEALNHSLEIWREARGCIKAHFMPMELLAGMWSILAVVCVFGALASLSSLRVLLFPPNPGYNREKLWIVSMLNLTFCDLLRCVLVAPLLFYSLASTNWWFGEDVCMGSLSINIMPFIVTEFTHLLIAFDRYMSAKHPNWMCRTKFGIGAVAAVWTFCAFTALPLKGYVQFFDLHEIFGPFFGHQAVCAVKSAADSRERNIAFLVALYIIPNITILYFYSKTHNELRSQIIREEIQDTILRPPTRCLTPSMDGIELGSPLHFQSMELAFKKADGGLQLKLNERLRNMAMIFAVCSLPLQLIYTAASVMDEQLADVLIAAGLILASMSASVTPIYIIASRKPIWDFIAFDSRPPRPARSVSEQHLH